MNPNKHNCNDFSQENRIQPVLFIDFIDFIRQSLMLVRHAHAIECLPGFPIPKSWMDSSCRGQQKNLSKLAFNFPMESLGIIGSWKKNVRTWSRHVRSECVGGNYNKNVTDLENLSRMPRFRALVASAYCQELRYDWSETAQIHELRWWSAT